MSARSGAMMSGVGNPQIYEAKEQRTSKDKDKNAAKKYDEGQEHAHIDIDSKDERSIGNRLAAASKHSRMEESTNPTSDPKVDPLGPATSHGNEPSKGAKVDAEIMAEEEEELKRKGKA
ncbi:hypothetical protein HYDPIDRAFT_129533 [Hydnomerulius pinastri MD-312]|nr:hypothetical protein HYDPIDRAFT_129533 [Hydnomerulius pinastri MD-312]